VQERYPSIDRARQYLLGFSNGGLFAADLLFDMASDWRAVCDYMGGLSYQQMEALGVDPEWLLTSRLHVTPANPDCPPQPEEAAEQPLSGEASEGSELKGKGTPPILVVTGSRDQNLTASIRCARVLRHLGCAITLWNFDGFPHCYRAQDTRPLWDFFESRGQAHVPPVPLPPSVSSHAPRSPDLP
jgi:dienelactone hydrolase